MPSEEEIIAAGGKIKAAIRAATRPPGAYLTGIIALVVIVLVVAAR